MAAVKTFMDIYIHSPVKIDWNKIG